MVNNDIKPGADTPACGLRERKRRATRRLVEDAATSMVLDRGYDEVTVEDICAAAEISRRTFFNYFPSKDAAIFGGGTSLFAGQLAEIRDGRGCDPLASLLTALEDNVMAPPDADGDLDDPRARHRRMRERRREIVAADPRLAKAWLAVFEDGVAAVGNALRERLDADPDARRLPDVPADEEAVIIVSLVRAALNDAMFREAALDGHPLHDAVARITRFLGADPDPDRATRKEASDR